MEQWEEEEKQFNVFLLDDMHDKLTRMSFKIEELEDKITTQIVLVAEKHEKMMEGFKCIEQAFRTLAGSIILLGDDIDTVAGTVSVDPWAFS